MRAWQLLGNFGIANLKMTELPNAPLGARDVRVKIHACSLNYRDLMVVRGEYNPRQTLPLIPVSDGAGEVIEIGSDVVDFKIGDRVCGTFSQRWCHGTASDETFKHTLGSPIDGVLSESRVFDESGLIRFPDHLSYLEAATLPCAGVTAFNAMTYHAQLKAGESVLIEGTGGVSIFSLQFAKAFGLNVILTSKSDEKLAKANAIHPIKGINYLKNDQWHKAVMDLTNGDGVDAVIEVGGSRTISKAIQSVKRGGTICVIGVLTGAQDETLDLRPLLMGSIRLQGIFVGGKTVFTAMNRVIAHAKIKPVIDRVFKFSEAPQAFSYLASGDHFGKVCIAVE